MRLKCLFILSIFPLILCGCSSSNDKQNHPIVDPTSDDEEEEYVEPKSMSFKQKNARLIDKMPYLSTNYIYEDWEARTKKLDDILFNFAKNPEYVEPSFSTYFPVGYWDKNNNSFGIPSYVGHVSNGGVSTTMRPGRQESIPVINSVYGASLVGIDKSKQTFTSDVGKTYTYDFVSMLKAFYNPNCKMFSNNIGGTPGSSFWYDLYPHIMISRVCNLYPSIRDDESNGISLKQMLINGADKWLVCSQAMLATGNIKYSGYNFDTGGFVKEATHVEPPVGGMLYVFYNAYQLTGDSRYIVDGVMPLLDFLETHNINPNFEIMSDYIPYVASLVNFKYGKNYNVERFINYMFDNDSDCRYGMGLSCNQWGSFDAYGLVTFEMGQSDGEYGYAFLLNTIHLLSTLVPMLNYSPNYANIVGKWILNVTNSARIFFGNYVPTNNQSCSPLSFDPEQIIGYEGVRSTYNDKTPYTSGDPIVFGWGETDYGIYGSSLMGVLGGLVSKTEDDRILKVDISKADSLKDDDYQSYLYFNPYSENRLTKLALKEKCDVFDVTENRYLGRDVEGNLNITLSPQNAKIIRVLPVNSKIIRQENAKGISANNNGYYMSENTRISEFGRPCLNLESKIKPKTSVSNSLDLTFSSHVSDGDSISKFEVLVGSTIVDNQQYSNNYTLDILKLKNLGFSDDTQITFKIYSAKYKTSDSSFIRIKIV